MEYLDIEDTKTEGIIRTCLENNSLIPILGSGYTKGEKSNGGVVPDGEMFKKIMISSILNSSPNFKDHVDQLNLREFSQIAEIYLNVKIVPAEIVKDDIKKNFLGVKLQGKKREFLKIGWPYLYTLNIDDAIEGSSNYVAVLPYLNISKNSRDVGCVYKVHGDATHEIIYDDETNLIFSSSQYIRSLIKNESMLLFLKTDLVENNILFVGCSLRNEIDLLYSVIGQDEKPSVVSRRIYVTTTKPDALKELDLETYNINTVILTPDYDIFYTKLISIAGKTIEHKDNLLEKFLLNEVNILEEDKNINLDFLLKVASTFNGKQHYITIPNFAIERSSEKDIAKSCACNPITIVKGRRFSGKSLILLSIANQTSHKHVYFFPSTISVTNETLIECFSKENSLFIFDTNVLNYKDASFVRDNIATLTKRNSSILIACNPTEIDIAHTFSFSFDGEFYFEIENKLDSFEIDKINKKLSKLGIINFKNNRSLLDNTFYLSREYPDRKSRIVNFDELDNNEIKTLLVVAVFDKIYSSAARAIGIHLDGMKKLAIKLHPILELEEADKAEIQHHSHTKLSLNSKPWLFQVLSDFNKNKGNKQTSKLIKELVESFIVNQHFSYISQKVIMFDTLNQVFSYEDGGSGSLIKEVYIAIQPLLSDNPDYWLQRAKSILKLELKNIDTIKDGIDYAKKAFKDGVRNKTVTNAEFTIALLHGKLCFLENYSDYNNIFEAIEWFYTSINKNKYNKAYIDSMLEHSRKNKGPFHNLCNYLKDGDKDIKLLNVREKVQALLHYYNQQDKTKM